MKILPPLFVVGEHFKRATMSICSRSIRSFVSCRFPGAILGILLGIFLGLSSPANALELSGTIRANHDPSRIIEANGKYWIYSTGGVINVRSSTDLIAWQWEAGVFGSIPSWMVSIGNSVGDSLDNIWAPDVIYAGGHYLNYYSRDIGLDTQEHAVLGVATASSPAGPWTDQGMVLDVVVSSAYYRVIDPAPIIDQSGNLWVAVGSFGYASGNGYNNGGIRVYQMNAATGKRLDGTDTGTRIAGSWIEAPYLHYFDGYYYLFFNEARCCNGLMSTYFVRVGRSANITGPYADMDGASLLTPTSGGTLFMGLEYSANYSNAGTEIAPVTQANTGSVAAERGPGHVGIDEDADGISRVTYHYYDGTTGNGEPTLGMKSLVWGKSSWPRIGWEMRAGTYALGCSDGTGWIDGGSASPAVGDWSGQDASLFTITRVSPNHFTLVNRGTGQALERSGSDVVWAAANPSSSSQRWFIEQTNDSSFRLLNQASGAALTRNGASLTLNAYTAGNKTQNWFVTPAGAHRISSLHSGHALAANGLSSGSGVVQQSEANSEIQYWWLIPNADGTTRVVNVSSGLALSVAGASTNDNAAIEQQSDTGSASQEFSFDGLTDGTRRIVPELSGKALGVVGASTSTGANVNQQRWTHVKNQQFELEFISGYPSGGSSGTGDPGSTGGAGSGGASSGGSSSTGGAGTGGNPDGCSVGYELCGDTCVDTTSNASHCGACGVTCGFGEFCSLSICDSQCASGLAECGQSCVDFDTHLLHCGACGATCLAGQTCEEGTCTGDALGEEPSSSDEDSLNDAGCTCSTPGTRGALVWEWVVAWLGLLSLSLRRRRMHD